MLSLKIWVKKKVLTERRTPFFIQNSFVIINDIVKNKSTEYVELSYKSLSLPLD